MFLILFKVWSYCDNKNKKILYRPGRMASKKGGDIEVIGVKLGEQALCSKWGNDIMRALKYPERVVASQEYVEPMDVGEQEERVEMEVRRHGRNDVLIPTAIRHILEVKKIRGRTNEIRLSNEVLLRINRRFLRFDEDGKWCKLCQKCMNSTLCLNDHLRGKIHRAKVAENLNL